MAVVEIKGDKGDPVLAVPVSMWETDVCSFKKEGDDYPVPHDDYYRVYTFDREYRTVAEYSINWICEHMPGKCGGEGVNCPHLFECYITDITEEEIEWDLIP